MQITFVNVCRYALIDQLTGEFEPEEFHDDYRVALERVIESKLVGGEPVTAAPAAPKGKVGDLMDALKASIESTKSERSSKKAVKAQSTAKEAATANGKTKIQAKKARSKAAAD